MASDTVSVTEAVAVMRDCMAVASDVVSVTEGVGGALDWHEIGVEDSVGVTENAVFAGAGIAVAAEDSVGVADSVAAASGDWIELTASQNVGVTERVSKVPWATTLTCTLPSKPGQWIPVATTAGLPPKDPWGYVFIDDELCGYTSTRGETELWIGSRGQGGTTSVEHTSGAPVVFDSVGPWPYGS